ncbi:MAG TPA: arylsulfatase [Ignavibacteria bacterium]|nr:arylsulfatase [Ignavibacteria bacterium]
MKTSKKNSQPKNKNSGKVLPFPAIPSTSKAGETLAESTMIRRPQPDHLPKDAPNILIILMDDVGFGQCGTFGGEVNTPTLSRLRNEGIAYNTFHTTSICSPTRASILTGRNHQRVHSGTIAERAVDWDGYTGVIPETSATIPEVLKEYGYKTCAFGKWHNTPADQTTSMGPFDRWPNGHGFEYFYGFLAGETSQWEPRLYENYNTVEPPHKENYHLTEDLADKALTWLSHHRAYSPDKPFFMYWAPGAAHGPHHIHKEWADKYKGKFNEGWDEYRKRVFERQKKLGWIPKDTELTERAETMASWESIPESERAFQRRLMEVFAGFAEHADVQAGKVIDGLEEMGLKDNTLIFYIWGDNGSSAEGQAGSISELLAQNQIPNTIKQQIEALDKLGGLEALGSPKTDNMYHAGWAWAGTAPFKHTKLIASHFGGTRNPMVVSWPKKIKADKNPRCQFHHVNDVAPTIYDVIGITPPDSVNGFKQDPIDGVSMKYTFNNVKARGKKEVQYFENNGSRGIYCDGWYACAFGPLYPWLTISPGLATWDSKKDIWELYDLTKDFSQAKDLAKKYPKKLAEMKKIFLKEAKKNKVFPIGGGIWTRLHPEDRIKSLYSGWTFDENTIRMPEFTAPGLGRESNKVTIDIEVKENANGVLYSLGGFSGGLTCFAEDGKIVYEYNMMIIERYTIQTTKKLSKGKHKIEVITKLTDKKPLSPAIITVKVDGKEWASGKVGRTVPAAFTPSESFNVGIDLGSPVSERYFDKAPFRFNGKINSVKVDLI